MSAAEVIEAGRATCDGARCIFGRPHSWGSAFVDDRTGAPHPAGWHYWCPICGRREADDT